MDEEKIKLLEVEVQQYKIEIENLKEKIKFDKESFNLINSKLGHSIQLMSEFHLSQEDKIEIGTLIDSASNNAEVVEVYEMYFKRFYNKENVDDSDDYQWSSNFKNNLFGYFVVSNGYNPIAKIGDNLAILAEYFNLENKIRSTPESALRNPMVEKLMKDRELAVESMNNSIDIVNSFNTQE